MNILLTGGTGFVGSYLTDALARCGHYIFATYNKSRPSRFIDNVEYLHIDLTKTIEFDKTIDVIIHTACLHPHQSDKMEDFIKVNIDSARNIVNYARKNNIKNVIYFSSKSIYGEICVDDVVEDTDRINQDYYGLSKYIAELIFADAKELNTIGLRTPGIVGPGAHNIWLVNLVNQIREGRNVTISDNNTRNIIWIGDIADYIILLLDVIREEKTFKYNVINISSNIEISNIEIAEYIKKYYASKSKISAKHDQLFIGNLNSDKAIETGFKPMPPIKVVDMYLRSEI